MRGSIPEYANVQAPDGFSRLLKKALIFSIESPESCWNPNSRWNSDSCQKSLTALRAQSNLLNNPFCVGSIAPLDWEL